MRKLTLSLAEINKCDTFLVGQKAYRLSGLSNQGLTIPQAFVITTKAYDLFLKEHFLEFLHQALTPDLSLADKAFFCSQLREKILEREVPVKLKQVILKRFKSFGFEKVSLRSSATVEDSKEASFAGQFETFLEVSKEEVLDKIKECWASLFSLRAIVYTHKKGLALNEIKMAIIVQKMVKPRLAGNLITRNLLREKEEILIETTEGLGDKVTAGIVAAEQTFVDKRSSKVVTRRFSPKGKELLSEEKAICLAKLGLLIEVMFNIPAEIEWAIEEDKVLILQARPLTI